jgi:cobalt-zinc-cadmium efflux system protein
MKSESRLTIAFFLAIFMTVTQLVGGLLGNSLTLFGNAAHSLTDVFAFGLSVVALKIASKQHTSSMTYGYHRVEDLVAFINGGILAAISALIFYEAFTRLLSPPVVEAPILVSFASLGLLINFATVAVLWDSHGSNLNFRAAFLHVQSDVLASIGAVAGGVLLYLTKLQFIDSVVGALIGGLILKGSLSVCRDSGMILLEGMPSAFKSHQVADEIMKIQGVRGVHELHVWTIASGLYAMTAHVSLQDQLLSASQSTLKEISDLVRVKFGIIHVTLQFEPERMIDIDNR